jgi:hypothetical protein
MWPSAILDPDFPKAIAVQKHIDSKAKAQAFPMATVGDKEKGVDKGVRILSLGMYISKVSATMLTAPIKIMEALEPIPSS